MNLLKFVDHYRGVLVAPPLVFAAVNHSYESDENDILIWSLALLLFLVGMTIRVWAQQHLRHRLPGVKMKLTTTGPYALVRNPLYVANTILCLSLIIASRLIWLIPFQLLLCATVYSITVRNEEGRLMEKYGQPYKEYTERVPRWFPRLPKGFSLGYTREYLRASILAEAHNLLLLAPFIVKELVSPWFKH
ncbi:MAG TPA: methyltransferase family protein [Candidatus Hypogeohydataceae bacterium YC41]